MSQPAARHLRVVNPNEIPEPSALSARSGGLFVAANVVAGFLHYLYQAVASRQLPLEQFSALNAWFANFSLFMFAPTLLQYFANFIPLGAGRLRSVIVVLNCALLISLSLFLTNAGELNALSAVLILAVAALNGWMAGQAQSRLLLGSMAVSSLLVGLFKLATLGATWLRVGEAVAEFSSPGIGIYTAAILIGFVPSVWFLSFRLWSDQRAHPRVHMTWANWTAPVILSFAASILPQMDLVLLNQTQSREVFAQFAQASLFYKALYFIVFAYLQWLLPQQVRANGLRGSSKHVFAFAGLGLSLSALAALIGPFLGHLILKWGNAPPALMIFLACLNTCLLTWIFVRIQATCASGRVHRATMACLALSVEAGLQMALGLGWAEYLFLALFIQLGILIWMSRPVATPPPGVVCVV